MKKKNSSFFTTIVVIVVVCFSTCKNDKATPDYNQYPSDIGKIIFTKCATPGCHNDASKGAAAGLSLATWDKLFEGGNGSACVIPYRSDYSTLFYYTNTFPDLGITLTPIMPYNKDHLSREEVTLLKKWIDAGAPNSDGFIKFSDTPNREKFYVTNQNCDVVTIVDQETLLPMRYINVGNSGGVEYPHNIKVSPDGKYWYVIFTAGNSLQKYRSSDDAFVGEAIVGFKNWNTITISNDGNKAYVVDWESSGDIAEVNLNTFAVNHNIGFNYPHGSCLNPAGDTLYITQNSSASNKLYKIPVNDFSSFQSINLFTTLPPNFLNTHEVLFSPDGTKYFVTCQGTSEVRIFQQGTDLLLATIPVGLIPQEMAVSATKNYLFVTCQEDTTTFPGKRGSVAVIDITSNSLIKKIYTGHQPHGIGIDDSKNMVFVANRNQTTGGPASHHSGACGGKNGYITFIDMNTLTLVQQPNSTSDKKIEVSVDPYSIAIRH